VAKLDPASMLREIGGGLFGQVAIAEEALAIYEDVGDPDKDPAPAAWGVFMQILNNRHRLADAFGNGFSAVSDDVMRFIVWRGLCQEDAADVSQVVALSAWNSFRRYAPWILPWKKWAIMIANNKTNSFLKSVVYGKDTNVIYLDDIRVPDIPSLIAVEPMEKIIAVQHVAIRWINKYSGPKKAFAMELLRIASGESGWIGPQGTKMQAITGTRRRPDLHRWFLDFAEEARIESNS